MTTPEVREMEELARSQPPDERGPVVEESIRRIVANGLATVNAGSVAVSCTVTLCRISGTTSADTAATTRSLRDDHFLAGLMAAGYSPGAEETWTSARDGSTFVFFANRET